MPNYYEEDEIQGVQTIDITALSKGAQYHLIQHVDQEGELAMKSMISLQRTVAVGNRAIAAQVAVSQAAMMASQMIPQDTEKIGRIVDDVHEQIRKIVCGKGRY